MPKNSKEKSALTKKHEAHMKLLYERREEIWLLLKGMSIDSSMNNVYAYVMERIKEQKNIGETEMFVGELTNSIVKALSKNKKFSDSLNDSPWANINALLNNILLIYSSVAASMDTENYNAFIQELKKAVEEEGRPKKKHKDPMFA